MAHAPPPRAGFEAVPEEVQAFVGAFFAELVRSGVRDVCISPGSRSTPLVAAAHAQPGLRCRPILDERSAGFFALGLARQSGRPVALICTSGSATTTREARWLGSCQTRSGSTSTQCRGGRASNAPRRDLLTGESPIPTTTSGAHWAAMAGSRRSRSP